MLLKKRQIRFSFALIALLVPLVLVENFLHSPTLRSPSSPPLRDIKSQGGFYLAVVKGRPINPVKGVFETQRDLYFFFKSDSSAAPTHLKWYTNDSLLFIQKCRQKDYCSGHVDPKTLKGNPLLSVDVLRLNQLLLTRSIEVKASGFAKLP